MRNTMPSARRASSQSVFHCEVEVAVNVKGGGAWKIGGEEEGSSKVNRGTEFVDGDFFFW